MHRRQSASKSAKTSPRAGDWRVTRSRFAIPSLFCHPTHHSRCLGAFATNSKFPRNWMRRGSSPRFAASATAARERVTSVVTSVCSIWLRQRSTLCASVMVARRYLERRDNTRRSSTSSYSLTCVGFPTWTCKFVCQDVIIIYVTYAYS